MPHGKVRLLVSLCSILLLAGCEKQNSTTATIQSPLHEDNCRTADDEWYFPAVRAQQCGVIPVRENPADSNSRMIDLHVLRLPAVTLRATADPLMIISGGPGQSALKLAKDFPWLFADVRKQRDLIFIDQRGTGKSSPLECELGETPDNNLSSEQQHQHFLDQLQKCAENHAAVAPYYVTPFAVEDMEVVRQALGYEKMNLWGVSYGTRVALSYLRAYPQHVRSVILDGVAPAGMELSSSWEVDNQRTLSLIAEQCTANEACQQRYGDVQNHYQTLLERLADSPLSVTVNHPRTAQSTSLQIDNVKLEGLVRMSMYSRDIARLLPFFIHEAVEQRYQPIAAALLVMNEQDFTGISYGMHYTVLCNEDYKAPTVEQEVHSSIRFMGQACAFWPKAELPESYYQPVVSDVPVLLLSGERDPVTPPRWGEKVKENLSQGLHVVVPGGHHFVSGEGCIRQLMTLFIQAGSVTGLDTSCVNNIAPFQPYLSVAADEDEPVNVPAAMEANHDKH